MIKGQTKYCWRFLEHPFVKQAFSDLHMSAALKALTQKDLGRKEDQKANELLTSCSSSKSKLAALQVLRDACKAAVKGFPETMEAHQRSLNALQKYPARGDSAAMSSQNRKALITRVKLQEQKILQRCIFTLTQRIKELS